MGFEAPLALLGLLTAVLPWLAHQVRKKDARVVPLPTLRLLQEADAADRKRANLSDLLLLLARIGLLAMLCLALATPYVTARVSFGDGEVSAAAVVIDDSRSMQREHGGSTLLARAVDRALDAVRALPEGSEVTVVLAGTPPRTWVRRSSDLEAVAERLRELPARSHRGTALQAAVTLARAKLAGSRLGRKRVLVLSDFAAHSGFTPAHAEDDAEFLYEPLAPPPELGNAHIAGASLSRSPGKPGQWSVLVEVEGFGALPDTLALRASGPGIEDRAAEVALRDGRGRATLTLTERGPSAAGRGDPRVRLTLDVLDALAEDNHVDTLLRDERAVRVLLVNGDPHPAEDADELRYLARALSLAPADVLRCRLQAVDAASLSHVNLAPLDVVVLANVTAPAPEQLERLRGFVARGGGLIVAAGSQVSPQAYNARLESLLGVHISTVEKTAAMGLDPQPDPALLPHGLTGLEQAGVARRLVVDGAAEPRLKYRDGAPAVLTHTLGRGTVVLVTTTLDADWNDLPLRPGFLPLSAGLVRLAASAHSQLQPPASPGAPVTLPVPPGAEVIEVLDPDDIRHRLEPAGAQTVTIADTTIAGAYRVSVASDRGLPAFSPELSFVVPPPFSEADLRAAPDFTPTADDRAAQAVAPRSSEVRRSLTGTVLLLAALFGLLETGLRVVRGRRKARAA